MFVSNGFMSIDAARHMAPLLDAVNIDIKAFTDGFYKKLCGGRLEPVLETVRLIMKTLFHSRFGHDHYSDRAQVLLLA